MNECDNKELVLNVTLTNLPNQTLIADWYNGHRLISYLYFKWIAIAAIEADAFNKPAFGQLITMKIYNLIHIVDYHMNMFNGLRKMAKCHIYEQTESIRPMPKNILHQLNERLSHFEYEGDIGDAPVLTNLFGGTKLQALETIVLDCCGKSKLRSLAAENFSGLPAIIELNLASCGIESIAIDTFDQIADTLLIMHFAGNQMLDLTLEPFRPFLDRWPGHVRNLSKYLVLRFLDESSFDCSMDFYRLRNATMASFRYDLPAWQYLSCKNDIHDHQQQTVIHPQRWHLKHAEVQKYALRKFDLRFNADNRSLTIRQGDSSSYRLFIWSINIKTSMGKRKCPSPPRTKTNAICLRYNKTVEFIAVSKFADGNDLIAVCVIHMSMRKQSVPLHCRTIRLSVTDMNHHFIFNWMHFGVALLIIIIIISIMAFIVSDMCQIAA